MLIFSFSDAHVQAHNRWNFNIQMIGLRIAGSIWRGKTPRRKAADRRDRGEA